MVSFAIDKYNKTIEVLLKSQVSSNLEIVIDISTCLNIPSFNVKWALSYDFQYPNIYYSYIHVQ